MKLLKRQENLKKKIFNQIWNHIYIWDKVYNQTQVEYIYIWDKVYNQTQVEYKFWDQNWDKIWYQIRDQVKKELNENF